MPADGLLRVLSTAGALLFYFTASALLTWPVIVAPSEVLFGDFGDTRGGVWWLWAKANGQLSGPVNTLIAAPFGVAANPGFSQPVTEWLLIGLAVVTDEVAAYNLYVFLAFPLTATATYFVVNQLLDNKAAAFVAGGIFGFAPAAVMQATAGHASFAFNVFVPVYLLALFYNRRHRTLVSAAAVALSMALVTFTALYFGYFAIYVGAFFLMFELLTSKNEARPAIVRGYAIAALLASALILPFQYRRLFDALSVQSLGTVSRPLGELQAYSARPWEYVIPSVDHPVVGELFYDFVRAHLHGSNIPEQSLYLGLMPLAMLAAGFVLVRGNYLSNERRAYFLFFAFAALWMWFLSLPPVITFGTASAPTLSYFVHKIAPMFRVYARFGILVNLFVACAVAVVIAHLHGRWKRAKFCALVTAVVLAVAFEYWSVPPGFARPVDRPPEVYQWLRDQPGDFIVAEYPMMPWSDLSFYTYVFWQRVHAKRLMNGAAPHDAQSWALFEKARDLADPITPLALKAAGVQYVIVHKAMYAEGIVPRPLKRYYPEAVAAAAYNGGQMPRVPQAFKLIKTFGDDMVFLIEDESILRSPGASTRPLEDGV